MIRYHKLVRDRIPGIITSRGAACEARTLNDADFRTALRAKLTEEVDEYLESGALEELADIEEVVRALAGLDGHDEAELEAVRCAKKDERGAFADRIFLVSVSQPTEKKG